MVLDDATRKALIDAVLQNVKDPPDDFWLEVRRVLQEIADELAALAKKWEEEA